MARSCGVAAARCAANSTSPLKPLIRIRRCLPTCMGSLGRLFPSSTLARSRHRDRLDDNPAILKAKHRTIFDPQDAEILRRQLQPPGPVHHHVILMRDLGGALARGGMLRTHTL